MEMKQPDVHLKALLNSPVRFTPAVPTPDWSSPLPANPPSTNSSTTATNTAATTSTTTTTAAATTSNLIPQTTETLQTQTNTSQIIVATPGAGAGEPHTTVNLQNCVVTVDLNCKLNLTLINARTRNSEYNPSRFHGVVMRLREPRSTALIFSSGKVVCTGNRNEHAALLATKKFARIIQKLGFNVRFTNFKVQNLVATCDLRFPIKLEDLNNLHGQFSSYEPELFPGLIYRMVKPRIVLMIFVNGKIVFTGGKTRVEIKDSLDTMYPILRSFRKR